MSVLNISRVPEFLDPWFTEIETIWNELEAASNDHEARLSVLENAPFVLNVNAASPLSSTGGSNPTISIQNASSIQTGALTSTDWNTFNLKIASAGNINTNGIAFGTGTKQIGSTAPLLDGQIVIGRTGLEPLPASITGTVNQVNVNSGPATISLSLPQNIHTTAQPTFSGLKLNGATSGLFTLQAGDATSDYTIKMPASAPSIGQVLSAGISNPLELEWKAAAGTLRVDYFDPVSTTLPSGPTVLIDGVAGVDGDLVLFSNLSSGNNRVYELTGVGIGITWNPQPLFALGLDPSDGESVRFRKGTGFHEQLSVFNGLAWEVNKVVRFFNGADYWELGSLNSTTLSNNTTGDVFSVTALASENIVVNYSLVRGSATETGQILMTTDGSTVQIAPYSANIGSSGITFSADISAGNVRLRYTSDNSGSSATMKFYLERWSNGAGGPAGVPSYTPSGGGSVSAAGNLMEIQFHGSGGVLAASSGLKWDSALGDAGALNLGGLEVLAKMNSATINDNQVSPLTILEYDASDYPYCVVEYGITRGTEVRTGRLYIANNGSNVAVDDSYINVIGTTGVTFMATIVSGNVRVQYLSTSTGTAGVLSSTVRRWA